MFPNWVLLDLNQESKREPKTQKRTQHAFLKEISLLSSFLRCQWWFDPWPVMSEPWCAQWVCNQWKSQTCRLWLSLFMESLLSCPLLFFSFFLCCFCIYFKINVMYFSTYPSNSHPILRDFESCFGGGEIDVDVDQSTLKVIQTSRSAHGISTLPPCARLFFCETSEACEVEG